MNLWPRPIVVFINPGTFDSLSATAAAPRCATPCEPRSRPRSRRTQADETNAAANLCRRGVMFVTAGAADLAALRRAVQPVYDRLERHAPTKAAIEQIQSMRSETPDAPACASSAAPQSAAAEVTPIDGVYRVRITAKELLAAGSADASPENYGSYEMTLDRGRFTQLQPMGYTAAGTYTVAGDTVTWTYATSAGGPYPSQPGEVFDFRLEPVPRPAHARARQGQDLARELPRQAVAANRGRALTHGDLGEDPSARPGTALDTELPAERLDAIAETAQARSSTRVGAAHAVVGDLDDEQAGLAMRVDPGPRRARVLRDVRQRLSAHEVRRRLDGRGIAPGVDT